MRFELSGTEVHTLEIEGSLDPDSARRLTGLEQNIRVDASGAEVSVLFFAMRGLGMTSPVRFGPRFDYGEALWRVGIEWQGEPAWLAVACDINRAVVRAMGRVMVRYPVRAATIEVGARAVTVETQDGRFEARLGERGERPPPVEPRPLLVAGGRFRIPWREDAAPHRQEAAIEISSAELGRATFGASVEWRTTGLVHEGRVHRCGVARSNSR